MTITQVMTMQAGSSVVLRYIRFEMGRQIENANNYWETTTQKSLTWFNSQCTAWVRTTTGQVCLAFGDGDETSQEIMRNQLGWYRSPELPALKVTDRGLEATLIATLTPAQAFTIMNPFFEQLPQSHFPPQIHLPSIWMQGLDQSSEWHQISQNPFPAPSLHSCDYQTKCWSTKRGRTNSERMPNGWTRFKCQTGESFPFSSALATVSVKERSQKIGIWWYAQRNHIHKQLRRAVGELIRFTALQHRSRQFCAGKEELNMQLTMSLSLRCRMEHAWNSFRGASRIAAETGRDHIYLFLYSPFDSEFVVANPPDSGRYYWTFDRDGGQRLTEQEVETMGLPRPVFESMRPRVIGLLDEEENKILRSVISARGFDPDTQDLAVTMGYPLIDVEPLIESARELFGFNNSAEEAQAEGEGEDAISMPGAWRSGF
ncbi:hypothetical protein FB45DRAFT_76037 [Roridomyces roridus]|uniref:Uncharacterized protein n=1 Tax=Roridomyces roridus TaxID=1738132 RepID=A0AAD7FL77_9AGAR|nr:hypothetical protein FB45DRAFT_76037 [Roridomyces roridus]